MKISIVVVTYNEEKEIGECLDSLVKQACKADEIILVDDGSTDKTLEIASKYPTKIIKSKHGERSRARNIGWRKAVGDIIIFAEADSVFGEDWISEINNKFKEGADAVIDRRKVYKPESFLQRCLDVQFDIRYKNYKPFSAWGFRKSVLQKLGGFDEKLNQSEDRDLGNRLLAKGYRIYLADKAVQYHKGEPKNLLEYINRAYISEKRKVGGYYLKYPDEVPVGKMVGFSVIFIIMLFAIGNIRYFFIFILFLLIYLALIFYKIIRTENGWRVAALRYLAGLSFFRILRNVFVVLGFVSGKVLGSK